MDGVEVTEREAKREKDSGRLFISKGKIGRKDLKRLKALWNEQHKGASRAHLIKVLGDSKKA